MREEAHSNLGNCPDGHHPTSFYLVHVTPQRPIQAAGRPHATRTSYLGTLSTSLQGRWCSLLSGGIAHTLTAPRLLPCGVYLLRHYKHLSKLLVTLLPHLIKRKTEKKEKRFFNHLLYSLLAIAAVKPLLIAARIR